MEDVKKKKLRRKKVFERISEYKIWKPIKFFKGLVKRIYIYN